MAENTNDQESGDEAALRRAFALHEAGIVMDVGIGNMAAFELLLIRISDLAMKEPGVFTAIETVLAHHKATQRVYKDLVTCLLAAVKATRDAAGLPRAQDEEAS